MSLFTATSPFTTASSFATVLPSLSTVPRRIVVTAEGYDGAKEQKKIVNEAPSTSEVSSVEIERICNGVDSNILETAAIGVPPSGGGPELLTIAVVFKDSNSTKQDLKQLRMSFNSALQKKLNPLFRVSQVVTLPSLPRTASNKVMRRVLRQQLSEPSKI